MCSKKYSLGITLYRRLNKETSEGPSHHITKENVSFSLCHVIYFPYISEFSRALERDKRV